MSENLNYYLKKNGIKNEDWNKIDKATAEWLKSRKQWSIFDKRVIDLLLTETAFTREMVKQK